MPLGGWQTQFLRARPQHGRGFLAHDMCGALCVLFLFFLLRRCFALIVLFLSRSARRCCCSGLMLTNLRVSLPGPEAACSVAVPLVACSVAVPLARPRFAEFFRFMV